MNLSLFKKNLGRFGAAYTPARLLDKIGRVAKKAGIKTVYAALLLYNALLSGNIPLKHKAMVVAALGYFILPTDVVADILPGGLLDDAGMLLYTAKMVWDNITPETHARARRQLAKWFGDVDPAEIKL